ncbi:V-set and immunoglobulin domain-containing protein 1-like isoform X1 [Micropterus salmoides]|uniref:V-set and immunoglobulin domain-containing protein 1-like isoform X1 n=2 Tax=Micropterus salmoides TaxID=27706 RepID=UPI0018ED5C32|nr:V-set and immunoglobulin domain-containing protein 1-like isoform X1 [Micropterus salmoides]
MFSPQQTSTAMELLPLLCLLLSCSAGTSADQTEPEVIRMVVKEGSEAILPCSLGTTNIKGELFDWKKDEKKEVFLYDKGNHYNNGRVGQDERFKGRVFHFQEQLQFGNASIVIRNTKVTDSGSYTCDFPLPQRKRQSRIALVVDPILKDRSAENIPGASPKPYVKTLKTDDGMLLLCEVLGAFPKPTVEWQDSAGNKLPAEETQVSERGGSFYIILQTAVTRADNYRCVATQEEINHQIEANTYVEINGSPKESLTESATGWKVAVAVLSLVVVVAVVVIAVLCVRRTR